MPGRAEAAANIHIGIDWLASVSFGHIERIGRRVVVLGGGNTAMDCCRSARRLGGEEVTVVVRSGFDEMKASPWEKEDAMHEGIPILNWLVPAEVLHENGRLTGMRFQKVKAENDAGGPPHLVPTGEPDVLIPCDDVLVAIGQENSFPWIERDIGIEFDRRGLPELDETTFQSTNPRRVLRRRRGLRPEEHHLGRGARARGRDLHRPLLPRRGCGASARRRSWRCPARRWASTSGATTTTSRSTSATRCRSATRDVALRDIRTEVELGYDRELAFKEAQRCLNCDVQTVFTAPLCIECDACVDICPMDCITFTANGEEGELRTRLKAPALEPGARTSTCRTG